MSGKFGGGGVPCTKCQKTVYPAETIQFEKKPYHVDCFTCNECTKKINAAQASQYDNVIYCTHCFDKLGFAQKQRNVKWVPKKTSGGGGSSKYGGGGTPCTVCSKTVYPAETVSFEKQIYHAECLKCTTCSKKLKVSDAAKFDEKVYCRLCFDRGGFRQKQAKVTGGTGTKKTNALASKFGGGGTPCTVCTKTVYPAETLSFEKKVYHQQCFKCSECSKKITPSRAAEYENKIFCTQCFAQGGYSQKQRNVKWEKKETKTSNPIASRFGGGGNPCQICKKTVYPAETVSFEKKAYHQGCFRCTTCNNKIQPAGAAQYEDSIYCNKCFKEGGFREKQAKVTKGSSEPKQYDSRFAKFGGGGSKCVICEGTLYPAETLSFEKQAYHIKCFACKECKRTLRTADAEGHDGDVYCVKCFRANNLHIAKVEIKD